MIDSAGGRNVFHVSIISWSYRRRGNVARTHTKMIATVRVIVGVSSIISGVGLCGIKKIEVVSSLINKILVYSAIKISANLPALYSMLNPETSSDSPSAKSNGVRLVSARVVANHINLSGRSSNSFGVWEVDIMVEKSYEACKISGEIKIIAILTSYEIVWATLRSEPSRAYFEFENQPAAKVEYTFILERHRKKRAPIGINREGELIGYKIHRARARRSLRIGANRNGSKLAWVGEDCSFRNSFIASAKGWGSPINNTLFGPFRS